MTDAPSPAPFDLPAAPHPAPSARDGAPNAGAAAGAAAAFSITLPHALGVGLIAFAPLAGQLSVSALALWSAAVPGALMTLLVRTPGVIYAPSTAVALLFSGMLVLVLQAGAAHGITAGQGLAITGLFVAIGFWLQWLIGRARLAGLTRFLPVSVVQGFTAGVGLTLVLSQLRDAMGASSWAWQTTLVWHLGVAGAVALLSVLIQRRWPHFPSLLWALLLVSIPALWLAPPDVLRLAAQPHGLILPPLPDWLDAPWWAVIEQAGVPLLTLSLLLGVVNGLEVLVFHQFMETAHGVRSSPDWLLRRESAWSAACALLGMMPSSTSTSRSRVALTYTGRPTLRAGHWHALAMLLVALTGHLWLHWLPAAALAGALLVAGLRMVPADMWRAPAPAPRRAAWWQSWLVAATFALSSGAMALLAGLTVSIAVLLRTSAAHVVRRMHLQGQLRSRHLRRADIERWLAPRRSQVAVVELQGILSFGVATLVGDQVRQHLNGHRCVILDASRVLSWDDTGYARLRALATELQHQGVALRLSGVRDGHQQALDDLQPFADLDRALDWAEEQLLRDCPLRQLPPDPLASPLGDLACDLPEPAQQALLQRLVIQTFEARAMIIQNGDQDRRLMLVQQGSVTLSTAAVPDQGLRLACIGPGVAFGEMAFLNGMARTAYAHAGPHGAVVCTLGWPQFEAWAQSHPDAALAVMKQIARLGIRRLGEVSQELRAAMA